MVNLEDQPLVSCLLSVVSCPLKNITARLGVLLQRTTDHGQSSPYSSILRSLSALLITDTELNVMAAAAIMGLSSSPSTG